MGEEKAKGGNEGKKKPLLVACRFLDLRMSVETLLISSLQWSRLRDSEANILFLCLPSRLPWMLILIRIHTGKILSGREMALYSVVHLVSLACLITVSFECRLGLQPCL